jgi:hypothetical protein
VPAAHSHVDPVHASGANHQCERPAHTFLDVEVDGTPRRLLEHLDSGGEGVLVRSEHVVGGERLDAIGVDAEVAQHVSGISTTPGRYDLNLWIGGPLEGATYLPR